MRLLERLADAAVLEPTSPAQNLLDLSANRVPKADGAAGRRYDRIPSPADKTPLPGDGSFRSAVALDFPDEAFCEYRCDRMFQVSGLPLIERKGSLRQ